MVSIQKIKEKQENFVDNTNNNKNEINKPIKISDSSHKVKLVAKELKFVKILAGNDPKLSEKQLNKFKKWLKLRSNSLHPFENHDFLRLWKGLFYCMWMSDKPLVQEKLAEDLASLILCFDHATVRIQFYASFLQIMNTEWFGIDQWRIDKFMMLVRRMNRQILATINSENNKKITQQFANEFEKKLLCDKVCVGFFMHCTEIFFEEIAKVCREISAPIILQLIRPFAKYIAKSKNYKLSKHIVKHVFHFLLYQSDLGREYQERFSAWKHIGFAGVNINDLEMTEEPNEMEINDDDENDNGDKQLDPRAGQIDVFMPEIKFNAKGIVNILENLIKEDYTNVKSRKILKRLIREFTLFSTGQFPIGIQKMDVNAKNVQLPSIENKANEFIYFEKKLLGKTKELRKMNKKKRKQSLNALQDMSKKINKMHKKILSLPVSKKHRLIKEKKKIAKQQLQNSWQEEDVPETLIENQMNNQSGQNSIDNTTIIKKEMFNGTSVNNSNDKNGKIEGLEKNFVINPIALKGKKSMSNRALSSSPITPLACKAKKVKIMLNLNRSQDTNDYIRQIRSSPNLPYDSTKKPAKSLLKPNLLPSPINPYYKKKNNFNI